jgi:hypothetical protein
MCGFFNMRVYYKGRLIERYSDHNLIVNGAKDAVVNLLAGASTGKNITRIAFGTNGSLATPNDTVITSPYIKNIANISYPAYGQIQFDWNLLVTEANDKDIFEFGLLCADGTLYARKVRKKALSKDSDFALEGEWIIKF